MYVISRIRYYIMNLSENYYSVEKIDEQSLNIHFHDKNIKYYFLVLVIYISYIHVGYGIRF